jgi:hypothetical protein
MNAASISRPVLHSLLAAGACAVVPHLGAAAMGYRGICHRCRVALCLRGLSMVSAGRLVRWR